MGMLTREGQFHRVRGARLGGLPLLVIELKNALAALDANA